MQLFLIRLIFALYTVTIDNKISGNFFSKYYILSISLKHFLDKYF